MRYTEADTCFILWVEDAALPTLPEACSGAVVMQPLAAADAFWRGSDPAQPNRLFILDEDGALLADCSPDEAGCEFTVAAAPATATGARHAKPSVLV